jgi:hypothetical protein
MEGLEEGVRVRMSDGQLSRNVQRQGLASTCSMSLASDSSAGGHGDRKPEPDPREI